ncbi:MAG: glycosyltransferase family 2 protein [Anaerolineales bacterium]|nr:glycosyltransferase family 2 protein [Anaerolineales bacterium]
MTPKAKKTISIVVPVYFNEPNLPDTVPQLLALEEKLTGYKLELIFVDDGSQDQSLAILLDYQKQHPKQIKVVTLTRNFGTMAALQAGLTVASGNCVGVIAADLQDPPELFLEMTRHWERGVKAIFAVRSDREESFLQKAFSNLYYALVRRFAVPGYPSGGFDFFLVDRQVIDEVNKIHEKNTNLMTLIFWLGYQAVFIPYVRRKRAKGKSRWTFGKKIKLFVDTFVSFSYFPIRLFSFLGIIYAIISFSYGVFIFVAWLTFGIEVQGWVPMMLVLTFTAGLQMTLLGILGEYLWRTLDEARGRPLFVIDTIYDESNENSE